MIASLRTGAWAEPSRVRGYLRLMAGANLIFLVLAVCRAHGWVIPQEPHFSTEFASFYAAGRLADRGQAWTVYAPLGPASSFIPSYHEPAAHHAMEIALAHDPQALYFAFFYPPVFLLPCAVAGLLPFTLAYLVWVAASGGFFAWALKTVAGGWRKIWPALAFTSVVENAGVGENTFWSAGLLASGLFVLERRPLLAGACFGALCYKPHFLLPVVLFLIIGGQWRALVSAGVSAALLCAASAAVFGWRIWGLYFSVTVPHANWEFAHHGIAYDIQVTPGSAIRLLGGGAGLAELVSAAAALLAVAVLWRTRHASFNIRAAALCASFPLLASVMLHYDLCLAGLAMPFFWREAQQTGFRDWEKSALAALFALPLVTLVLRTDFHVPVDWLIPTAFLLLLAQRASSSARRPAPPRAA